IIDEGCQRFRLVGVEARLALRLEGESWIGLDGLLDRVEALAVRELEDERRESGAPESLQQLLGVAPDLRIEARAAGLEYADDSPLARRETEPLAERSAPEPASDRVACDHFRGSRLEHAPFDDAHPRAQGEPARPDAADPA